VEQIRVLVKRVAHLLKSPTLDQRYARQRDVAGRELVEQGKWRDSFRYFVASRLDRRGASQNAPQKHKALNADFGPLLRDLPRCLPEAASLPHGKFDRAGAKRNRLHRVIRKPSRHREHGRSGRGRKDLEKLQQSGRSGCWKNKIGWQAAKPCIRSRYNTGSAAYHETRRRDETCKDPMNSLWHEFLSKNGAMIDSGAIIGFGRNAEELRAARDASIVAPLSHFGLFAISGADATDFLHGQLSSDVKALRPGNAQFASYCSPKGRVLANFLLWRQADGYSALLARDLAVPIRKRLSMFVMRSKVMVVDASDECIILGISGPAAEQAIWESLGVVPGAPFSVATADAGAILALGDRRYIAVLRADPAESAWIELSAGLVTAGEPAWRWLDIHAGVPWITAATQDQFVPQMANLELIGAVNFHKGCYPGQEIVARTQYLGKLKRRLFGFHADIGTVPAAGTPLYCADFPDQACGMVVDAVPAPDGGCDLLAVAQADSAAKARLALAGGPVLSVLELPYSVPLAA
jgi:hypothetical protein